MNGLEKMCQCGCTKTGSVCGYSPWANRRVWDTNIYIVSSFRLLNSAGTQYFVTTEKVKRNFAPGFTRMGFIMFPHCPCLALWQALRERKMANERCTCGSLRRLVVRVIISLRMNYNEETWATIFRMYSWFFTGQYLDTQFEMPKRCLIFKKG